jgi:hypothetical protein
MKLLLYVVLASSTTLVNAQDCRIAGQVFFADVVDHAITIKTDSGDLVNFNYDNSTSFRRSDASANRVPPEDLNNGDHLCVGTSEPAVVKVTQRQEINAQQKKELTAWQADSLYGVVSGLDRQARQITLEVSAGGKTSSYSIRVSPSAVYWIFPRDSVRFSDAVSGSLDRVNMGDPLYVRGTKDGASQKFVANAIVSGGFRSFAATIETMEILDEALHVRLVLSGNRKTVHISFGELYAVGREGSTAAGKARRLYRIDAADLQPGDTVLILGINEGSDSVRAGALIAGFSPFGVLPPDPSQQMRWIFDNVPLGDPYLSPAASLRRRKP